MAKLIIDGREYGINKGARLKDALIDCGYAFPCGGEGRCGKCRIKTGDLSVTNLDRRFLTEDNIKKGVRLACDKVVEDDIYVVSHELKRTEKMRELTSCNLLASIGVEEIKIAIMDDEIAEVITVPNPIIKDGFNAISDKYTASISELTNALRAILAKESIELLEKYAQAKGETYAIATSGIFAKILMGKDLNEDIVDYNALDDGYHYGLPCEEVYFLPIVDGYIGGDILAETVNHKDGTLIIDSEKIFTAIKIDSEDDIAVEMWGVEYNEMDLLAIKSALLTLLDEEKPFTYVYGKYAELLEDTLLSLNLTYSIVEKNINNVAKACLFLRYRTRMNKEKQRISVKNLLADEKFHAYLAGEE